MTAFFVLGAFGTGLPLVYFLFSLGTVVAWWLIAFLAGRRFGLTPGEYFRMLEKPFYKSRDDYSPQD